VKVIESEHVSSLIWEEESYRADIHESVPAHSLVTRVRVNSSLSANWKHSSVPVLYGFHAAQDTRSLRLFAIDSLSGTVTVASDLVDRETIPQHIITVKARDSQTYSFVRLLINILDVNDKGNYPPRKQTISLPRSNELLFTPPQLLSLDSRPKSEYQKHWQWAL
jgi:hypothetical protein